MCTGEVVEGAKEVQLNSYFVCLFIYLFVLHISNDNHITITITFKYLKADTRLKGMVWQYPMKIEQITINHK